eukprot:COSAG02_NODE_861_length_16429_cov_75.930680_3_plen_116_part_00
MFRGPPDRSRRLTPILIPVLCWSVAVRRGAKEGRGGVPWRARKTAVVSHQALNAFARTCNLRRPQHQSATMLRPSTRLAVATVASGGVARERRAGAARDHTAYASISNLVVWWSR